MKILLTGVTGYIAQRLLPVLLEDGHHVVCCVRDASRFDIQKLPSDKIEVIQVDFLKVENGTSKHGIFKLTYFVEPYFKKLDQSSFYPFIEVVFEIKDDNHYHVPITLSPFGYSTYRGN